MKTKKLFEDLAKSSRLEGISILVVSVVAEEVLRLLSENNGYTIDKEDYE